VLPVERRFHRGDHARLDRSLPGVSLAAPGQVQALFLPAPQIEVVLAVKDDLL
jgi:hypothetical protein